MKNSFSVWRHWCALAAIATGLTHAPAFAQQNSSPRVLAGQCGVYVVGSDDFVSCVNLEIADALRTRLPNHTSQRSEDAAYVDTAAMVGAYDTALMQVINGVIDQYVPTGRSGTGGVVRSYKDCTTYDADASVGAVTSNNDVKSCLTATIQVYALQAPGVSGQLAAFTCRAISDEPVVETGLSCRSAAGGVPVYGVGHNVAATAGIVALGSSKVCVEASGLHPGRQSASGVTVGAARSTFIPLGSACAGPVTN